MLLSREPHSSYKIREKLKKGEKCLKILIRRLHVDSESVNKLESSFGNSCIFSQMQKKSYLLVVKRKK
jgi:hypothetical protein